jgi:hypothetical protein
MAKEHTKDLTEFLKPFSPEIQETALWLRAFVWDLYPNSNELIYDSYSALAFGWGLSDRLGDVFCSIAVYGKGINFGFNRGAELSDPGKILVGNGNIYRYLKVAGKKEFPAAAAKKLLKEAYANALARFKQEKQTIKGQTMVKAVYAKKRRPVSLPSSSKK